MTCAIVIPIYRTDLSEYERMALQQCHRVLSSRHAIVVIHPRGLDVAPLTALLPSMTTEAFAPEYFHGMAGYNRLMLSTELYDRFARFDYMLIYQPDAWMFEDRLGLWMSAEYDYVGAPWIPHHRSPGARALLWLRRIYACATQRRSGSAMRKWAVGNGGLSLRRPSTFSRLLRQHASEVPSHFGPLCYNEDVWWATTMRRYLKVPSWREALDFAIESEPEYALRRLDHLPMGVHGWNKPPYDTFWLPLIISKSQSNKKCHFS